MALGPGPRDLEGLQHQHVSKDAAPTAAARATQSQVPLAAQIADLSQRLAACEARLGDVAEGAAAAFGQLDLARLGTGKAKTMDQLSAEIEKGSAKLMLKEDALGKSKPVRVVETVLLRLYSMKEGGKVLVETATCYPDGRKFETFRLPGTKRERNETPRDAVRRIRDELVESGDPGNMHMKFDFDKVDIYTEERDSETFPGLRTLYRIEIIEGHVTSVDPELRQSFGLEEEGAIFVRMTKKGDKKEFSWLTDADALDKQVKLRGDGLGRHSLPLLTPISAVKSQSSGTLSSRVMELQKKVDQIFQRDNKLTDLDNRLQALEAWIYIEPSSAERMLQHERAKRRYVLQHARHLRDFNRILAEINRMEPCINPLSLQELPACTERLRRLEARSAIAVNSVMHLHTHVSHLTEDYHKAMVAVNEQMLRWNSMLAAKPT